MYILKVHYNENNNNCNRIFNNLLALYLDNLYVQKFTFVLFVLLIFVSNIKNFEL